MTELERAAMAVVLETKPRSKGAWVRVQRKLMDELCAELEELGYDMEEAFEAMTGKRRRR
jgi:hypothetical protein